MREIQLTQGKVALVDDADYAELMAFKWRALKQTSGVDRWYALRSIRKRNVLMHVHLTEYSRTDHIDGNGLNNQRANLREATKQQNGFNYRSSSGVSCFKGVSPYPYDVSRWRAGIRLNGVRQHLGIFDTEEEAARAYNQAATEQFGEFAYLNELPDD
jgi:hypothetical protein